MEVKKVFSKNRIKLGQFFMAMLGIAILFTGSLWEENGIAGGALFLLGAILSATATVGRMWCSVYISGYKKDVLITTGPYSMSRNPLYFFSLLGAVGVGLATRTLAVPAIIFIAFMLYYPVVISREEERLTKIHGEDFRNFKKRVPMFFPSFSLFHEPEEYTIKPKFLRGRFSDSLWFVIMIGILALIESLHRHGIVPVYFKLY
ncbi:MAG: isoprenylcysteine carboxylmethyltransferase family protein [Nitrospirae bacterium]|nr:isoprenylcysteine carboxylmethyltransferase family protein [Nitrospirota bacterium]